MIARSLFVESKKLRVFDFDDTLVKTTSFIYVTHSNGKTSKLTPGQYAVYKEKPGDEFDFKDFEQVKNPKIIKSTRTRPFMFLKKNNLCGWGWGIVKIISFSSFYIRILLFLNSSKSKVY